ncbi:MAG: Na+/H+ antiporter NhaC family protein [Planctomycetota bacterium]|nr:Na+/H+ antiporter NhaC family protein [Planctomycetota bacterium]
MTRALPLAAFAVVIVGLFLVPQPDATRLAALHAAAVLNEQAYTVDVGDVVTLRTEDGEVHAEITGRNGHRFEVTYRDGDLAGTTVDMRLPALLSRLVPAEGADVPGKPLPDRKRKEGDPTPPTLWELIADDAQEDEDLGKLVRVRLLEQTLMMGTQDPKLHADLAGSVLRGLRAIGADDGGFRVLEHTQPEPGLDAYVKEDFGLVAVTGAYLTQGAVQLAVDLPDGRLVWAWGKSPAPGGTSLLPPLVAILLAIILRQPVLALLAGVLVGSVLVLVVAGQGIFGAAFPGLRGVFDIYLWNELIDSDRQKIVAFVIFMLAMVGVIIKAGGIHGLMQRIARLAKDARRTQIATWFMGLAIFFDDYANSILVGSTMRSLTDKFKVAREKLAYIVDSTAAPVAGISILSTWIAFEVSTFSAQLPDAGLSPDQGYEIFLRTLPYRFYCLFTLFFVGLIVFTGRDFGPMLTAERRARAGQVLREGAKPMVGKEATELEASPKVTPKASMALVPILVFVFTTLGYIFFAGGGHELGASLFTIEGATTVLYDGSGFDPLMYGSLAGLVVAAVMAAAVGLRGEIPSSAWASLRSMGVALIILYLAWSIGAICGDLNTAEYLAVLLGDSINPLLLPVILFALSGFVAFSTGSSWSTMTILLPLVVGLAFHMGETLPGFGGEMMVVVSIGAVLEGAIFGDHCSPISDTTVMSSIACASDHVDHVRTQMPYAITTMVVALLCGYLPAVILGLSPWLSLLLGCAALTAIVLWKGQRADDGPLAA